MVRAECGSGEERKDYLQMTLRPPTWLFSLKKLNGKMFSLSPSPPPIPLYAGEKQRDRL